MTRLHDLAGRGQAIWLDFIRRSHLADGSLQTLGAAVAPFLAEAL
jgi:hypothetical protein